MEQTALRPKPMPGQDPCEGGTPDPSRRPHAAPRRGRRLRTLLFVVCTGTLLVLAGIGIGTVGATVIGMSRLAELQRQAPPGTPPARATPTAPAATPSPAPALPAGAALGVEAVDAEKAGALVVGVHVPGPGYTAGLVRGDVLLQFGSVRVDTAADLARAVARARPGKAVLLTVRHSGGGYQQLTAVPGVVT
ncbi:PDZ domain-containing protein [Streptomyces puniciscabiei]|uniref:PDZ domain-containing protein n=1 Tax=Streptomyces puniciscabiei TaxID=164348 RepID=A0A542U9S1_9ACTN|nr:PDZ domain-containing protein [Streptomyces puniciscabiei]TQK95788.1 PDZ domain-containing protein [Streptomyces puniciscabiei]